MKLTLINLVVFICSTNVFSQGLNCGCDKKKIDIENRYHCDTSIFTNGAKIYWQWNCDSSWLTFENKEKSILRSCEEMDVGECQRAGLNFLKEYPNYLLFMYEWISGCCAPPDLIFINKENGKEIKRINRDQFVWGEVNENYALYFSDSTYTNLIYLDHNTDNQYIIRFEKEKVLNSATKHQILQLTDLFKDFAKDKDDFTFDFKTSKGETEKLRIKIK